jgi:hypothetical protein
MKVVLTGRQEVWEPMPYPDARKAPGDAVSVPGQLIADHQLAVAQVHAAEQRILEHLDATGQTS